MVSTDVTTPPHSTQVSIHIEALEVRYRLYEERRARSGASLLRRHQGRRVIEVHALRGVDATLYHGEAVGVVGSNGSGKSTLLRAIAGVQPASAGRVLVRGEAHLLGVNAALNPNVSGYRNVMLGGLAMGMSADEVEGHMDDVIDFSGLGEAIDRPLRTYSSGMRARLAFSIATLRQPEILLIDEALAVGDKNFRARSLERINELRERANAVVMVTHNMREIRDTCSRAIWLEQGRVVADGDVESVLQRYEAETT